MVYSLVGAPSLGFDLARLQHGPRVGVVVRTALACTSRDLGRLARRRRDSVTSQPAAAVSLRVVDGLGTAAEALRLAAAGRGEDSMRALRRLEEATLGDLDALARFLRRDVLGWALAPGSATSPAVVADAADVLTDAAGVWFATGLPDRDRRRLAAPFVSAGLALRDEFSPTGHDEVDALLHDVAHLDPDGRDAWRQSVERHRTGSTSWAPAFHEASWAAHLTDRVRLGADIQMAGMLAFRAGGFEPRDAAYGVWNALSGALQAMLTADVLGEEHLAVLLRVRDRL